jgi:hypothetical protein
MRTYSCQLCRSHEVAKPAGQCPWVGTYFGRCNKDARTLNLIGSRHCGPPSFSPEPQPRASASPTTVDAPGSPCPWPYFSSSSFQGKFFCRKGAMALKAPHSKTRNGCVRCKARHVRVRHPSPTLMTYRLTWSKVRQTRSDLWKLPSEE